MSDEFISDINTEEKVDKETENAIANRENLEKSLSNMWGYSETGLEAKKAAMTMLSTKTGMYARIPLVCKADNCPYAGTCKLIEYNLAPYGEPCPVETAQIEIRMKGYDQDFELEKASFTDLNLVNNLISHDIMLERLKALLNEKGVLVEDVFAGVSEQGEVYTRPEVSKIWEAYERVENKRNKIYELMQATRKDKKGQVEQKDPLTSFMQDIISSDFVVEERPEEFKEDKDNNQE